MRALGAVGRLRRRVGRRRMRRRADASFAGLHQKAPLTWRAGSVTAANPTLPIDALSYPIRNVVVRDQHPSAGATD